MTTNLKETDMNTQLSTKLTALGVALMVNCMMLGAVAYLFSSQVHAADNLPALARTAVVAVVPVV